MAPVNSIHVVAAAVLLKWVAKLVASGSHSSLILPIARQSNVAAVVVFAESVQRWPLMREQKGTSSERVERAVAAAANGWARWDSLRRYRVRLQDRRESWSPSFEEGIREGRAIHIRIF